MAPEVERVDVDLCWCSLHHLAGESPPDIAHDQSAGKCVSLSLARVTNLLDIRIPCSEVGVLLLIILTTRCAIIGI